MCKTYKLYHSKNDRIWEAFHPLRKKFHTEYHALKNISFTVKKGEVLGIIGQNGSGKSTLLKILSSVVSPTSGSFHCNGRVNALLELGGGFNEQLTGIENIYYLGGIQGYSRREMRNRLDQILQFADIGVYADQKVSTYSSGMYVRLAFSMAINIDPEILIVDEALAVGDIRFQQKCFRKIREFTDSKKTILFCSHNLGAVRDYCTRAIWLHDGQIREEGDPVFVTDCYGSFMTSHEKDFISLKKQKEPIVADSGIITNKLRNSGLPLEDIRHCDSNGTGGARISHVALTYSKTLRRAVRLDGGEHLNLYVNFIPEKDFSKPGVLLILNGPFGTPVFKINSYLHTKGMKWLTGVPNLAIIDFQLPLLGNGTYTFTVCLLNIEKGERTELQRVHDACIVEIANPDMKFRLNSQVVIEKADVQIVTTEMYD